MQFEIQDILKQLDKEAEAYIFPMLDNGYYYHGDQKLTIFRDKERWAMTIETLSYNNHQLGLAGITTHCAIFGNCILTEKLTDNDNFFFFAEDDSIDTLIEDEELYISYLNPTVKKFKLRQEYISVIHDTQHYISKGINLEYPGKILHYEFMRGLIPDYSHLFWVTSQEIAKKIPENITILLTLNEWYHPDLANSQRPSETETFQQLAKVISSGDISFYKPTLKPNTHWRNWPEGGAL